MRRSSAGSSGNVDEQRSTAHLRGKGHNKLHLLENDEVATLVMIEVEDARRRGLCWQTTTAKEKGRNGALWDSQKKDWTAEGKHSFDKLHVDLLHCPCFGVYKTKYPTLRGLGPHGDKVANEQLMQWLHDRLNQQWERRSGELY